MINPELLSAPALATATAIVMAAMAVPALGQATGGSAVPQCSQRTLPRAERVAMEREFARRYETDGKASAESWLRSEAEAVFDRLASQGICTMDTAKPNAVARTPPSSKVVRDKEGKPCKRTRLANRVTPGFGGGPMTLALVPVCAD